MSGILRRLTRWCCVHALWVHSFAIVTFVFSAWTLVTKIAVVTDTDAMIDSALQFRQDYAAFQAAYPNLGNTIVVVIEAEAPEVRSRAAAALVEKLTADTAHFSSVYAPSVLPFFQENGLLLLSYDDLADRMDALVAAQPFLGPILREPSLTGLFDNLAEALEEGDDIGDMAQLEAFAAGVERVMSATLEGTPGILSFQNAVLGDTERPFIIVTAQPVLDPTKLQPAKAALGALQTHLSSIKAASVIPVRLSVTGKIALNAEELKTVSSGAATAGILSVLLVAIVLAFGVRSLRAVAAMLINLIFGLVVTCSAALWLFGSLNIISVAFAVLFIGLGIDFSIHILLRARENMDAAHAADALSDAAGTSGVALAVCAPTTALAFLSFTPTGYAGLAQLGTIAAIGVFVAMLTALTLLPALLTSFGHDPVKDGKSRAFNLRLQPKFVLAVTAMAAVPALYFSSTMGFNADPIALKDSSAPSVVAYKRLAAREDSSPYAMQLVGATLEDARALAERAKGNPNVGRVVWLERFSPEEQDDKLDLISETYDLLAPDLLESASPPPIDDTRAIGALKRLASATGSDVFTTAASVAQAAPSLLTGLEARLLETLPDLRQTLRDQLQTQGIQEVPDTISALYRGRDESYRIELFPTSPIADEADLAAFVDQVTADFPAATGSPVQIIESGRIVKASMLQATSIAFLLVTGFLWLVLRSFKKILLVLSPVILAGIFTLATSSVIGLAFNFANVIVLPLLLGLGVDAGIHYVNRAFEPAASHDDVGTTGKAVFLSTLTTIGSFGTLMVSGHDGTASMGLLLTIALCWLLVTTLVVLPALLSVAVSKRV